MLFCLRVSIWSLLFNLARAGLVNVTIDDSSADPRTGKSIVYDPPTVWNTQAVCQPGQTICVAKPSVNIVSGGTWHESTFRPLNTHPVTASIEFDGTAVYVYCVLATSIAFPSGYSDMTFSIDGQVSRIFTRPATDLPGLPKYKYDTLVYSNSTLSPGSHKLDITNGRFGVTLGESLMILDRIVYSFEDNPPVVPQPQSQPQPPPLRTASASEPPSDSAAPTPTTDITGIGSSSPAGGSATSSGHSGSASSGLSESVSSLNPSSSADPASSVGGVLPTDPSATTNPPLPSSPPSPKSSKPPIGRIVGAVLGALAVLAIVIIVFLICRRRRRRARAAAMLASNTSEITEGGLRVSLHRNSYYTSTPTDPFGPVRLPSPARSRGLFTFGSISSPANSPTSPGEVDPFPMFGDRITSNTSQGYTVGSDSKRSPLDADWAPPPPYQQGTDRERGGPAPPDRSLVVF